MLSACVLIDYQNIHLTGHDVFAPPGVPKHESLVLPQSFARNLMDVRNGRMTNTTLHAEVEKVLVFRGRPSNKHQPQQYSRSQAQTSEWTRDPKVEVRPRTLRYPYDYPASPAQEKGIDVMLAIELVQQAYKHTYDVLILASHDTDLEPAIEAAELLGTSRIETAGWKNCKRLQGGNRNHRWHTSLDGAAFVRSRDRTNYA